LPPPKVFVIYDESCNAFATGRDPKRAAVTLTTGIIKRLDKLELEGVIAHEMSHIGNRDIRLNILMIAGIGFCTFIGARLLKMVYYSGGSRRSSDSSKATLVIGVLGIAFLFFGVLIAPLLRLAVSRQREYQADATAVLLTRNPMALATALSKIAVDPRVEVLDNQQSVSAMCIADPLKKSGSFFGFVSGLKATHPPIDDRIKRLQAMAF
jgi:heat shock protein HtpX